MNVSNEQQTSDETIVRALRATRANDADTAPKRHRRQTDQCPNIARFAAVLRKSSSETWTAAETAHIRGCAFCQSLFGLFTAAANATDAAATGELTVTGMSAEEETQTGGTAPVAKKSGAAPKPAPRRNAE